MQSWSEQKKQILSYIVVHTVVKKMVMIKSLQNQENISLVNMIFVLIDDRFKAAISQTSDQSKALKIIEK